MSFSSLGGLTVVDLARSVWLQMRKDEVTDRAASLSYYFLFALFPTLLFLAALLGLAPVPGLMDALLTDAARVLPADAASLLRRTLSEVLEGASGKLVSIGALAALWAASSGTASIMTALNVAYHVVDERSGWRRRLIAIVLTLALSVFTVLGLLLLVFGERIGEALAVKIGFGPLFGLVWNVLRSPVAAILVLMAITLVYAVAPARPRRWRWLSPGALFALVTWLGASLGLRTYVAYFGNYNATYGSIGGVILLMLWLYLTGLALLIGAEIDAAVERAIDAR